MIIERNYCIVEEIEHRFLKEAADFMSLRFIFGPSGGGKSTTAFLEIIQRNKENFRERFFVIVPDQFTMQTQKDLACMHPDGGIMQIDVLSFHRLYHRILEEVGHREMPVLDDMGKSLVLQKIAADIREELPVLGRFLTKPGYISEVKSIISELMQYGIGVEDLDALRTFASKRGALSLKLSDIQVLYRAFLSYIHEEFVTAEETPQMVAGLIEKSALVKDSVILFDGFTGFTPVQFAVVEQLLCHAKEVVVTVTLRPGENPYLPQAEQKLFYLSTKMVSSLEESACRLEQRKGPMRGTDLFLVKGKLKEEAREREEKVFFASPYGQQPCLVRPSYRHRFVQSPALSFLEETLFDGRAVYAGQAAAEIALYCASSPKEEVHQTALKIRELTDLYGYAYRDIAVVLGDMDTYAPFVESEFAALQIPCFLDRTRGIVLNPMVESIKSGLHLSLENYSYEAMFHFLRSGLCDLSCEEIDALENYVAEANIRGYKRWSTPFTRMDARRKDAAERLARLNESRARVMEWVELLRMPKKAEATVYVEQLYRYLREMKVAEKLQVYEKQFASEKNALKEREYAQIYRLVLELLEQIHALLGKEEITAQIFADLMEAGFAEMQVGAIPQNVDRILAGDMTRTRLGQVKALFFLGANDGNVPKKSGKGGILSDIDREFLQGSAFAFAPTPRQQMYTQRLYLYMNLTKPSEKLFLSYAKVGSDGRSCRPSYLMDDMLQRFPDLAVEYPQMRPMLEQILTPGEGERYLAGALRDYVLGTLQAENAKELDILYTAYGAEEQRKVLTDAAFLQYEPAYLKEQVATALYGDMLRGSISRLEKFASCAYAHFLQYGLTLKEQEQAETTALDLGNLYHSILEGFSDSLLKSPYTWLDFPEEFALAQIKEATADFAKTYGLGKMMDSARSRHGLSRVENLLLHNVKTMQKQLLQGDFAPDASEVDFVADYALEDEGTMRLKGRIDRMDVVREGDRIYLKIVDYKSGAHVFSVQKLYEGLQLQLMVYLNEAVAKESKAYPDCTVQPAAALYYHIDDPMVESAVPLAEKDLDQKILEQMKLRGVIDDDEAIVCMLDRDVLRGDGFAVNVKTKQDGTYAKQADVMSRQDLEVLSAFTTKKIKALGQRIRRGEIAINPYKEGNDKEACTYCAFQKVCGYDALVPGYEKRILEKPEEEEVLDRMRAEVNEEK